MPSYYKPMEKREISNVTLIINTRSNGSKKAGDKFYSQTLNCDNIKSSM
jgi:hypothetical protein